MKIENLETGVKVSQGNEWVILTYSGELERSDGFVYLNPSLQFMGMRLGYKKIIRNIKI